MLLGVCLTLRCLKAIAHAVHGVEPTRVARIVAQLGAQVLDVRVNRALVALEVIAQDLLDQLHTRVDATGIAGERREQLELGGGQVDFLALDRDLMARDVDDQIGEVDLLIIDDLGSEYLNQVTAADLFECFNQRILKKKATLISTNLEPDRLRNLYMDRLFSRFKGYYRFVPFFGPDLRTISRS